MYTTFNTWHTRNPPRPQILTCDLLTLLEVGRAVGEMRYLKIFLQTLPLFNYQFLLTSYFAFHLFFRSSPTSSHWPRAWHRQICQLLSYLLSFLSLLDGYTRIDSMFLPLIYNTAFIYFNSYMLLLLFSQDPMIQLHYMALYKGILRAQMERSSGPQIC